MMCILSDTSDMELTSTMTYECDNDRPHRWKWPWQCRAFGTKTNSFIVCCHCALKCMRLGVFLHWKVLKSHSPSESVFVRFVDQIICFTCLHREWLRWGIKLETAIVEDLSEAGLKLFDSHVSSKTGFLIAFWLFDTSGSAMTSASHLRSAVQIYVAKAELIFCFDQTIYLQGFFQKKRNLGILVGTLAELKSHSVSHCVVLCLWYFSHFQIGCSTACLGDCL